MELTDFYIDINHCQMQSLCHSIKPNHRKHMLKSVKGNLHRLPLCHLHHLLKVLYKLLLQVQKLLGVMQFVPRGIMCCSLQVTQVWHVAHVHCHWMIRLLSGYCSWLLSSTFLHEELSQLYCSFTGATQKRCCISNDNIIQALLVLLLLKQSKLRNGRRPQVQIGHPKAVDGVLDRAGCGLASNYFSDSSISRVLHDVWRCIELQADGLTTFGGCLFQDTVVDCHRLLPCLWQWLLPRCCGCCQ